MNTRGFTLIELVVVLTLLGIMSVAVLPRFFDRRDFDARAFLDQTAGMLRYAQKASIAQRRTVCVIFSASSVSLRIRSVAGAGACDTDLIGPAGSIPYTITAPGSVQFAPVPADFSFNAEGRPSAGSSISINGAAAQLTIAEVTGYVSY